MHNSSRPMTIIEKMEGFSLVIFTSFECYWIAYGTSFHFSHESYMCRDMNTGTYYLWNLMMLYIAIGYTFSQYIFC